MKHADVVYSKLVFNARIKVCVKRPVYPEYSTCFITQWLGLFQGFGCR